MKAGGDRERERAGTCEEAKLYLPDENSLTLFSCTATAITGKELREREGRSIKSRKSQTNA